MRDDGRPPEFSGGKGRRRRVEGPSIDLLNYKDVSTLSRFMTEEGKILPRRTTKGHRGISAQAGHRREARSLRGSRSLRAKPDLLRRVVRAWRWSGRNGAG